MHIRWGRILLAALAVEVLTILVLVVLVALLGPREPEAASAYAERLGYWVGPLAGFVLCLLGGWWAARGPGSASVLNGALLGLAVAGLDVVLLLSSGAAFQPVFVASNVGRVLAGALGGWWAGRGR